MKPYISPALNLTIIVATLLLTGCGLIRASEISGMDAAEITSVSDRNLCGRYVDETPVVVTERQNRGLGDCSASHRQCVKSGFVPGTDGYLRCRAMLEQTYAQQDAANQQGYRDLTDNGLKMMRGNPPATSNGSAPTSCTVTTPPNSPWAPATMSCQ